MAFWTNPTSYRLNADASNDLTPSIASSTFSLFTRADSHESHPAVGHLVLLVFEAVMEVVCVSLPGYIVARQGMFDAEQQKFVANLNVALFTPCLIFTKLASQLTAEKLAELAVIPVIFSLQTAVSYLVSIVVARAFGFAKRPANFVTAMGVFGNSNSLPISLVISLSQTLEGLHRDKIPGDNDEEVAARGILYLLIFQQLGQLVRWSWGYHVLLAPAESYVESADMEGGRYRDEPDLIPGLDGDQTYLSAQNGKGSSSTASFESGDRTPVTNTAYTCSSDTDDEVPRKASHVVPTPADGNAFAEQLSNNITSFPTIRTPIAGDDYDIPPGINGVVPHIHLHIRCVYRFSRHVTVRAFHSVFTFLPTPIQTALVQISETSARISAGIWEFMNPPLWAMLFAVIVASIPSLQHVFFAEGSFIANSVTRAVAQSGGVAVPLILVVLGANLARNTLPPECFDKNSEENQIGTRLLVASLISRMVLPTLIMTPLLALVAKFIPISIVDDPIFVIVCFLLTGAPSALQLAQICQINNVYEGVMSRLLFQSYVIWILPSTLILIMCALKVVEWASL